MKARCSACAAASTTPLSNDLASSETRWVALRASCSGDRESELSGAVWVDSDIILRLPGPFMIVRCRFERLSNPSSSYRPRQQGAGAHNAAATPATAAKSPGYF